MSERIENKSSCYQCGLCTLVCPKGCIHLTHAKRNSFQPILDSRRCISCGKCFSTCQLNLPISSLNTTTYYLFQSLPEYENKCASGGAFYEISVNAIKLGYHICAASLSKEHDYFFCKHVIVSSLDDLKKVLGTKYIRSECWHSFPQILTMLKNNQKVLFVGTPCQVFALKEYTKGHSENLITIDLFCFGVASLKTFNLFLSKLKTKYKSSIESINFRKKFNDKAGTFFNVCFSNGEIIRQPAQFSSFDLIGFPKAFSSSNISDEICYQCKFKSRGRIGDISLGDVPITYFRSHTEYLNQFFDLKRGISVVGFNDQKGVALFSSKLIPFEGELDTICFHKSSVPSRHIVRKTKRQLFKELYGID